MSFGLLYIEFSSFFNISLSTLTYSRYCYKSINYIHLMGREEEYWTALYYKEGDIAENETSSEDEIEKVSVYTVTDENGKHIVPLYTAFYSKKDFTRDNLPEEIDTNGYNELNENLKLYYGFSTVKASENSIFFVVHNKEWFLFQNKFREALGKSNMEFKLLVEAVK